MTTASMTKISFRLFADFGAYLIRHPDKADLIPKGANVVFYTSKSPAFTAWSEARAADLKRRRKKVVTARQVGRSWRIASL
jgi:hypothetical protein